MKDSPIFGDPCGPWIPTFAWLPKFTFDAGKVWLVPVWKRHIQKKLHLGGGNDWWFQYRRYSPNPTPAAQERKR